MARSGLDDQTRWRRRNLLELKLVGQLQTRLQRKRESSPRNDSLSCSGIDSSARALSSEIAESAMIVESGHKTVVKNQAAGQKSEGLDSGHVGVARRSPPVTR